MLDVDDRTEVSLHLKLPGLLILAEAHDVAEAVEREILAAVPAADAVQTHIEPLAEPAAVTSVPAGALSRNPRPCAESCGQWSAASRASSASSPPTGPVAFPLPLDAPERARRGPRAGERDRGAHPPSHPEIVIVHTEP